MAGLLSYITYSRKSSLQPLIAWDSAMSLLRFAAYLEQPVSVAKTMIGRVE